MTERVSVRYVKCDFCTAKNHCAACGAELSQALMEKPGVAFAKLVIPDHALEISHSLGGGLEDMLDGMGLMAE